MNTPEKTPFARLGEIQIHCIYPPIPARQWDYCAYRDGTEENGNYGWGSTAVEAVTDLLKRENE